MLLFRKYRQELV